MFKEENHGQFSKESIKILETLTWSFKMIRSSEENEYNSSTSKVKNSRKNI